MVASLKNSQGFAEERMAKVLFAEEKKILRTVFLFFFVALGDGWLVHQEVGAAVQSQSKQVHWGYEGAHRPERWGQLSPQFAMCDEGRHQSPIDINVTTPKSLDEIVFSYQPSSTDPLNNGHTVEVQYDPGSYVEIEGKRYDLIQYHFHDPSEHTYKGKHYTGELHLVHQHIDGEFAVIGVLYTIGKFNPTAELFLQNFPVHTGTQTHIDRNINVAEFLPSTSQYYQYEGSFTTPPCSEGVHWFIMQGLAEISQQQWDRVQTLIVQGHQEKKVNRPTQPLNGRPVYLRE